MEYERIVIRNIDSKILNVAADQLHKYFKKNFKSLNISFWTSGNSSKLYMMTVKSDQPIEDETLHFCLGYAVRVIEELKNLFNE